MSLGDSVPEPDLMLLVPKRLGPIRPTASDVLLLIEVAESSLTYDLNEKVILYSAAGIEVYWVIDLTNRLLHRHLRPARDGYQQVERFNSSHHVYPQFNGSIRLDLSELFSDSI